MKILTSEEIKDHRAYTIKGGAIGTAAGLAISLIGMRVLPRRFPHMKFGSLPWSVRTAMFIVPPTILSVICAEEASNKFDALRYSGEFKREAEQETERQWEKLSTGQKVIESLSNNKYKIITSAWAGSLWGSWHLINRDPIMTKPQKIVQARMYAQFITVILLLGTIGLTTWEASLNGDSSGSKRQRQEDQRWRHALEVAEREETKLTNGEIDRAGFQSNEDRLNAKIFKH
ncbi:respiratory supercomplex factor 2, mitochondrial [Monosporozyma servazzii]